MFIGPSPPHTPLVNRRNNRRLLRLSRSISRGGLSPLPLVISKTSQQILLPSNSSPPIHRHVPSISPSLSSSSAALRQSSIALRLARTASPFRLVRRVGSQTGDQKRPQPLARALRRRDFYNRLHASGARRERRHGPRDRKKREYPRGRSPGAIRRERPREVSSALGEDEARRDARGSRLSSG
uniref:Uncharacterized protein n=1 Tax=Brassica oleracea TaxID=3712 RepID=A0A3P6E5A3_BRAOL|nr:unnamed protein product [Brassica oleracea]